MLAVPVRYIDRASDFRPTVLREKVRPDLLHIWLPELLFVTLIWHYVIRLNPHLNHSNGSRCPHNSICIRLRASNFFVCRVKKRELTIAFVSQTQRGPHFSGPDPSARLNSQLQPTGPVNAVLRNCVSD